jgi:hypothetical protein
MFGKKDPPVSEEHFRRWTEVRKRGEVHYVLTRGILIAAAGGVLGFLSISVWHQHKHFDGFQDYIIRECFGWVFAGFVTGISEWSSNEKQFQREAATFGQISCESPEQTLKQLQRGL